VADRQYPLLSVSVGWNVAPMWPQGSRAWKALPKGSAGPAPTSNGEVRADLHEPWLTARNRSYPLARARRGHGCPSGAQRSRGDGVERTSASTAREPLQPLGIVGIGPRMPKASGTAEAPRLGRSGTGSITLFNIQPNDIGAEVVSQDFHLLPAAGVAAVVPRWGVLQARVEQLRHRPGVAAARRHPSRAPRQRPPAVTVMAPLLAGWCRPSSCPWPATADGAPPPSARCRAPGTAGRRGCRTAGRGDGTPGSANRRSAGCTDGRRRAWASSCICSPCRTLIRAGC
jgi:hypothetical protein